MKICKIKEIFLSLLFPKFCLGCQGEGNYLCQDCQAILEISRLHLQYPGQNLKDLYFALNYQNPLIKNLIQKFKYGPLVKELAKPLSSIIIEHFQLLDNKPPFFGERNDFILIPVPLEKRRLKWRGFNQAEEIGKEISKFLNIPLMNGVLIKIKENSLQVDLSGKERKENVREVFGLKGGERIFGKKILLIDDVYTTGATLEEAARVLKEAGTKEVIGIVVARAKPGEDRL